MDLYVEYAELEKFAIMHFPPRRPRGHPDSELTLGELGPEVHHFRYRAELFLLVSGDLHKEDIEDLQLNRMMPEQILKRLRSARDYWANQKSLPINPEKASNENTRLGKM